MSAFFNIKLMLYFVNGVVLDACNESGSLFTKQFKGFIIIVFLVENVNSIAIRVQFLQQKSMLIK